MLFGSAGCVLRTHTLKNRIVQRLIDHGAHQMEGKEHDQQAYEKVKRHLLGLLLSIVLQIVEEPGDP